MHPLTFHIICMHFNYWLNWWYHPTISSSIIHFTSLSVLPMNLQDWFPLELTALIPLQFKGLSRVFSNTTVGRHRFFGAQPSLWSHPYMITGKTTALTKWTFVSRVMSLFFNMLSWFVIAFHPRGEHLLLWEWWQPDKLAELIGEAHWMKPPTLARPFSNHSLKLFYDRRSC